MTAPVAVAMLSIMILRFWQIVLLILLSLPLAHSAAQNKILEHANESWSGDLDGMTERGFVRILTVHNPLLFQFDGAEQIGLVAEWAKMFEDHLADEIGRVRSPTVVLIPVSRDELLPGLVEGRGDLVMGNLTITPDRLKLVDFGPPIHTDVRELIVTGPALKDISSFDDLVDTGLYVRRSSSYFEHLQGLNERREQQGKPAIPITEADENLEDYDLLDMVDSGFLAAIIVDSHKAEFWEQIFDGIKVHQDLAVQSGGKIAWALRKNSPQLKKSISSFSKKVKKGSLHGNIVINRYLGATEWLADSLVNEDRERYQEAIEIIKKYSAQYDFDWLLIAAQAYQESGFDHSKRSSAGAVGVMQVLPSTAADDAVDIPDITDLEDNIHAGIKYMHWLRKTYFEEEGISQLDKALFSLAAYNAGPGNMRKARRRAKRLGFNPDRWFGNTEIGMYRAVSGEPAAYVRNIYKYYVTYQGLEKTSLAREEAIETQIGKSTSGSSWIIAGLGLLLLGGAGFWMMKRREKDAKQES